MSNHHYHLRTRTGLGDCLTSLAEVDSILEAEIGRLSVIAARDGLEVKVTGDADHCTLRVGLEPLELDQYDFAIVECSAEHDKTKEGANR